MSAKLPNKRHFRLVAESSMVDAQTRTPVVAGRRRHDGRHHDRPRGGEPAASRKPGQILICCLWLCWICCRTRVSPGASCLRHLVCAKLSNSRKNTIKDIKRKNTFSLAGKLSSTFTQFKELKRVRHIVNLGQSKGKPFFRNKFNVSWWARFYYTAMIALLWHSDTLGTQVFLQIWKVF
jgi:hypothetical protein